MILYTIGCPKCMVLEKKLDKKGIKYNKVESMSEILDTGIQSAPTLELDNGERLTFEKAIKWVNDYEGDTQ